MLGAFLLLGSGKLYGQREVIATAQSIPSDTNAAPNAPATVVPVAPPKSIQQVGHVSDTPKAAPTSQPLTSDQMVTPSALLSGLNSSLSKTTAPTPKTMTGGTPVPPTMTGGTPIPPTMSGGTPVPPAPRIGGTPVPPAVLSVEVVGPDRLLLGQPFAHEIVLRNVGGHTIAAVHIEEPLPADAHVLKAEPPALKQDNRLVWDIHHFEMGGERRLKVELEPGHPGEMDLRPLVSFQMDNGLHSLVMRPSFDLEVRADRTTAMRGERIRFHIQLANHGDAPIRHIMIYDRLPSGLHHPSGSILRYEFGDLLAGDTRSIDLETTAVESGSIRNEILAQGDRGVEARRAVDVVVTEPSLSLRLDGPTQTTTQREQEFHLEVANPASLTAKNVQLVQTLPPTFEVVSASGASLDSNQHALVWTLTDLGAGQRHRVTFRIKVSDGGDWPMSAMVLSQNFPEAVVKHTLRADAAALLKMEVRASEDRLPVDAETVIRIHVVNKGNAACVGIRLTATLPEAVAPFKAEGPSSEQIDKQQVRFAPLPQLDAHGQVVYSIHVRGRQAGKGALHVELAADKQTPAAKEISIQVDGTGTATRAEMTKSLPGETLR